MNIYQLITCNEDNKSLLMDFIKNYWQEDHAFVKSDALLRFQHYNPAKKEYSFILGMNTLTNQVDGIIGLIPVSQYDPSLEKYNDTWSGIWKVRSDVKNEEIGILGMRLFSVLNSFTSHGSIGMSKVATKLHAMMQYNSCILNQYYILNPACSIFKIADIPFRLLEIPKREIQSNFTLQRINNIADIPEGEIKGVYYPIKSIAYLKNRFQLHPIYKYKFWGIYDTVSVLKTILVSRTIEINSSKIVRIVDVFGSIEGLGSLKTQFEELCDEEASEYIDIMNFGISPSVFAELGFQHLDVNGDIIIPNHFEPFRRQNINIYCAYRAPSKYIMFKADSDQDRPSVIK